MYLSDTDDRESDMDLRIEEVTKAVKGVTWKPNEYDGAEIEVRGFTAVRLGMDDIDLVLYAFEGWSCLYEIRLGSMTPLPVVIAAVEAAVIAATGTYYSAGIGRRVTIPA
jgi:hypothetical protein